jgi:hypothetical protein
MNDNPKDFSRQAQDFVTRSIAEQVRAAQRALDLAARFGRGELSTQAMYDEYVRFASQETSRYASELAMLGLNYYNDWLAMNQRYSSHFFEAFGAKAESKTGEVGVREAAGPRRVEMELHAPAGSEAVRSFVLENKRGGKADISFMISDFAGPAGTAPFRPPLQIQPDHFSLAPGQESTVTLRLPLEAGLWFTGQRYRGTIYVYGYDNLELGLTVWADPPVTDPAGTPAKPATVEGAGKKRSSRKAAGGEKAG